MTSVVSAITGSGAKKAAKAQAAASEQAIETVQQSLAEQLKLAEQSLDLQKDMFQQSLSFGEPYRNAGNVALAKYESMLYGIPIGETSSYKASLKANEFQPELDSEFNKRFYHMYASDDPNYTGRRLFYDPNNPESVVTTEGGTDLGTDIQVGLGGYSDALTKARELAQAELKNPYEVDLSIYGDTGRVEEYQKTPGYDFRLSEGQKALERSASARSGVLSGAQLKAQERYAQDFATNEYQQQLNRLGALASTGANMATNAAGLTQNSANAQSGVLADMMSANRWSADNIGSLQTNIGAAKASGYLGQQAAGTNLLNMAAGLAGSYFAFGGDSAKASGAGAG